MFLFGFFALSCSGPRAVRTHTIFPTLFLLLSSLSPLPPGGRHAAWLPLAIYKTIHNTFVSFLLSMLPGHVPLRVLMLLSDGFMMVVAAAPMQSVLSMRVKSAWHMHVAVQVLWGRGRAFLSCPFCLWVLCLCLEFLNERRPVALY